MACCCKQSRGWCWKPDDRSPRFSRHATSPERPIGILLNPEILNSDGDNKGPQCYPLRVEERDRKINRAGFVPECRKETTYQEAFEYRGKDPRLCRTYEFRTPDEKCTVDICLGPPKRFPPPSFGQKFTDLQPTIPVRKPYLIDDGAPNSWSEYMRTHSHLGGKIISYNLFKREEERYRELRRKALAYSTG